MFFDYARSRETATRMITRFGQNATLIQNTKSGPDYAPVLSETPTPIKVVDLNRKVRDRSGALVGETKRTLLVAAETGVSPKKDDKVVLGGKKHEIEEVRTLSPAGTDVLFEVDLVT